MLLATAKGDLDFKIQKTTQLLNEKFHQKFEISGLHILG